MKITEHFDILAKGPFSLSAEWKRDCADVEKAIRRRTGLMGFTGST